MIKVGSDFSGVGAFNQALIRLGIKYEEVFACDMDKYARQTFILNYGEPKYYPENVYNRDIPSESLDIFMTSPPCQSFSLAGKRKGEDSKNGVLFYNSHEFIKVNKPRYFIFENVKGLLSDDSGKTFQKWIDYLGGKSVNGNPVLFPHEESVPYHVYYQVMNAKHYGVPQNRERIFIIGIRDDADNTFSFPKPFPLVKRLKDVLENQVNEKYFLSDKMLDYLTTRKDNFNNGNINFKDENSVASTITKSSSSLDISDNIIRLGNVNPSGNGMNGNVFHEDGVAPTLSTNKGEGIKIASSFGNKRLDETLNSKEVPEEDCIIDSYNKTFHTEVSPCISTRTNASSCTHVKIGAIRGRNPENPKSRETGLETEQMLEINENGTSNALTTVQKDNVVVMKFERTEEAKQKRKESIAITGKDIGSFADRKMVGIEQDFADTILANPNPQKEGLIMIPANNSKGYDIAEEEEDSINFSNPNSETRRGRVGKGVAQTLDTSCNQGVLVSTPAPIVEYQLTGGKWDKTHEQSGRVYDKNGIAPTTHTMGGGNQEPKVFADEIIVLNDATHSQQRIYSQEGISPSILSGSNGGGQNPCKHLTTTQRIRRLTPAECFRLMDFNSEFIWDVSDSQAYRQAGNSIVVACLVELLKKLNL